VNAQPAAPDAAVAAVLSAAADAAERQPTLAKAVPAAWSACHRDRGRIGEVFAAWCRAERYRYHASGLGGVLRRRYTTPAEIAQSLRRAARGEQITESD
jgi:hypothetical protein